MTGMGPTILRVTVRGVQENGIALVTDNNGREYEVRWDVYRTPFIPGLGELWLIDRSLGFWTFAARIGGSAPDTGAIDVETDPIATSALAGHVTALDPHAQYLLPTELPPYLTGKEDTGVAAGLVGAHDADTNPHPQYATDLDLSGHVSASDPHSQYATDLDLSGHVSAADPHTGYQKESEKGSASGYAGLDSSGKVPSGQLPTPPTAGHIILDETTPLTTRSKVAFQGAGVTATDDPPNDQIVVTIPGGGSGGATWRGAWAIGTAYAAGDLVSFADATWLAIASNTGETPTNVVGDTQVGSYSDATPPVSTISGAGALGQPFTVGSAKVIHKVSLYGAYPAGAVISITGTGLSGCSFTLPSPSTPGQWNTYTLGVPASLTTGVAYSLNSSVGTSILVTLSAETFSGIVATGGDIAGAAGRHLPFRLINTLAASSWRMLGTLDERVRDDMGSTLVQGAGVTITVDDTNDTITIAATGGGSSGTVVGGSSVDVQTFTAGGIWTKPPGAKAVTVMLVGSGGGGGAGRMAAGTGQKTGGYGGGGGGRTVETLPAAMFGATETITVGAAGIGATGLIVAGNGGNGGNGGSSSIGTVLAATGGSGGIGGTSVATSGTTTGGGGTFVGGTGGPGQGGDPTSTGGASTGSGAGGGGGGGNSTSTANGGGTGGAAFTGGSTAAGGAGGAAGVAGSAGTSSVTGSGFAGSGGGGGGASVAGNGGAGANGGGYGGGGGGGGPGATASGGGGNGGGGIVVVITECAVSAGSGSTAATAKVLRAGAQSVSASTVTPISFDAESWDNASMHDNTTNPTRVTVPTAGKYLVIGRVGYTGAGGQLQLRLKKNGTIFEIGLKNGSTADPAVDYENVLDLAAGDYLEVDTYTVSGGAIDTTDTYLTVTLLAGAPVATKIEQFIATAGQTAFTTASVPAVGTMRVLQNGLTLLSGDFSLVGSTVTLAVGATVGDAIQLVYDGPATVGTGRDLRWFAPASMISIDEFNDDTIDPAWVRVDGAQALASVLDWTERGDSLSAYHHGAVTSGATHGIFRPLSGAGGALATGDALATHMELRGPYGLNYSIAGIMLSDGVTYGAGTQAVAEFYIATASGPTFNGQLRKNTSFTTDAGGETAVAALPGPMWLRIVYLGSNSFRRDYSPNGIDWIKGTAQTIAFTPTHVGLHARDNGSAVNFVASFECLRRMSGVT